MSTARATGCKLFLTHMWVFDPLAHDHFSSIGFARTLVRPNKVRLEQLANNVELEGVMPNYGKRALWVKA